MFPSFLDLFLVQLYSQHIAGAFSLVSFWYEAHPKLIWHLLCHH
jgi:hypothetical protein